MRIVVTGGSGLVGRRIVSALTLEHEVVNLDLRIHGEGDAAHVRVDILDAPAVAKTLEGADVVVHAAGLPGPTFGTAEEIERVNVAGTGVVAQAATEAGVDRIVFISSEAVLGFVFSEGRIRPHYFPIDEEHTLSPRGPYGRSKFVAEILLTRWTEGGGTVVALRPPWVWVPDEYEKYRALTTSPDQWWDGLWAYVHGDDVARAAGLAAVRDLRPGFHPVYVAAPDNGTTLPTRELLERFHPDVPLHSDLPEFGSLISSEGGRGLLGFAPAMTWREFLK